MDNRFNNPAALAALSQGDTLNALIAATPGGIERQEKAGQEALLASDRMPAEMRPGREAFEKVGFRWGAIIDDLFVSATLPAGWVRRGSDHAMWSYIDDDKGRERVRIFYKAAFYDRSASASLSGRISTQMLYGDSAFDKDTGLAKDEQAAIALFDGKEVYRTPAVKSGDYRVSRPLDEQVLAWLAANYPDWTDPTAYWDLP